jgi:hypothetical protein
MDNVSVAPVSSSCRHKLLPTSPCSGFASHYDDHGVFCSAGCGTEVFRAAPTYISQSTKPEKNRDQRRKSTPFRPGHVGKRKHKRLTSRRAARRIHPRISCVGGLKSAEHKVRGARREFANRPPNQRTAYTSQLGSQPTYATLSCTCASAGVGGCAGSWSTVAA